MMAILLMYSGIAIPDGERRMAVAGALSDASRRLRDRTSRHF
jgi:hypothetical protein